MIPDEIRPASPSQLDFLAEYQVSYEFHREVQYRQEFDRHCRWYEQTAQQHRQELQKMRGDINILSWFHRRNSAS